LNGQNETERRAGSRRAVALYAAILFAVVIFFIALSYFIGERGGETAEALLAENETAARRAEALAEENLALRAENAELEERLRALAEELEQAKLGWAADTKRIEDQYKADYNELLQKYEEITRSEAHEND
jgi:FtsZ-binding cell division protein ZapB